VLGHPLVATDHAALDYDGAPNRIDDAGKFDQRTVTCSLDHAAAVFGNLWIDKFAGLPNRIAPRALAPGRRQPRLARGQRRHALSAVRVPSSSTPINRL